MTAIIVILSVYFSALLAYLAYGIGHSVGHAKAIDRVIAIEKRNALARAQFTIHEP